MPYGGFLGYQPPPVYAAPIGPPAPAYSYGPNDPTRPLAQRYSRPIGPQAPGYQLPGAGTGGSTLNLAPGLLGGQRQPRPLPPMQQGQQPLDGNLFSQGTVDMAEVTAGQQLPGGWYGAIAGGILGTLLGASNYL